MKHLSVEDIGMSAFPGPEDLCEQHFVEDTCPESSELLINHRLS